MSTIEDRKEALEEETKHEVVPFKVLPGGKDTDWLKDLPVGTVFLCRPRSRSMFLERTFPKLLRVVFRSPKGNLRLTDEDQKDYPFVVTEDFTVLNELVEVLKIGEED